MTRHPYGAGDGWYVATVLDQGGVDRVVRRVLDRHGLRSPYPPGCEVARRLTPDGRRLTFLLNHGPAVVGLGASGTAVDLLSGVRPERLEPGGVVLLQE